MSVALHPQPGRWRRRRPAALSRTAPAFEEELALEVLGGIPTRHIRYDCLISRYDCLISRATAVVVGQLPREPELSYPGTHLLPSAFPAPRLLSRQLGRTSGHTTMPPNIAIIVCSTRET